MFTGVGVSKVSKRMIMNTVHSLNTFKNQLRAIWIDILIGCRREDLAHGSNELLNPTSYLNHLAVHLKVFCMGVYAAFSPLIWERSPMGLIARILTGRVFYAIFCQNSSVTQKKT